LKGDNLKLVSVGDSYIYKITDKIETLNTLHEGPEGGLTSFIGGGLSGYLQIWSGEVVLNEDATYLLVTDGVDYMKKEDLLYCKNAQEVIDKVLEGGAYDNITGIMIDVKDCDKKLV
jgi:serine/threonine protein phosphatase PrpC